MVDKQVSHQNRVSVAVLASSTPTPEPKWITTEKEQNHAPHKQIQVSDNLTTVGKVILCVSEMAGTAVLVFLGCMGCANGVAGVKIPNEQISLSFGLALMMAVQMFGHISGCHINPVVTVAAATLGNIPLIQVPIFVVGQLLGGLAGFSLVKVVTPTELLKPKFNETVGLCSPSFNANITPIQALLVEFLLSLIFVWVCCGAWDSRNNGKTDSLAVRFGLTIAGLAMAGGPYSGANMNPARSFGPALINGNWDYHWIYWVGPLSAGFFGALFYRFVFSKEVPSLNETPSELSVEK